MERIVMECGEIRTKEDFHSALAKALDFPAWYGGNLDALHDLLTEIGTDTTIQLHGWTDAEAALGAYGSRLEKVIAVSALENPNLHIEFC